ncbi:Cotton fiber protein [Hirschfeldia incana]|nr:Cotton fiber protein [Hirschfeldia incana]
MTEVPSYMIQNPKFEPYKPKKRYYYHSSSLLSLLLSIIVYILIFYIFEVSPWSIFKDTKVLFFISNTLILIIAADYGAFTDKDKPDFYGEYTAAAAAMRGRADHNYSPVPLSTYREKSRQEYSVHAEIKNPKDVGMKDYKEEEPVVKDIVCVSSPPEEIVREVSEEKARDDVAIKKHKPVSEQTFANREACNTRKHVYRRSYERTKSDKPQRVKRTEDTKAKRINYRRSESDSSKWMVVPEKWENVEEESEEFSKMSNEELNKRVEDFIQRFNKQIRLQSRGSST